MQSKFLNAAVLAALLTPALASAQAYPNKPIKIITGPLSGTPGIISRLVATELSPLLGQPVVVEPRAAGFAAGTSAAKAPADGYNVLLINGAMWTGPLFVRSPPYDALKDFIPMTLVARATNMFVVNAAVPARSVKELIDLAKAQPGKLNYSTGSIGSSSMLGAELFKSMSGIDITHIAYKDPARESADLLSGIIHLTFGNGPTMTPIIQGGKVRALATTGLQRSPFYPDLPTVASTVPGYVSETLVGLFAPAGTPAGPLARLQKDIVTVLHKSEIKDPLGKQGLEMVGSTPEQFTETVKGEMQRYGELVKALGLVTD